MAVIVRSVSGRAPRWCAPWPAPVFRSTSPSVAGPVGEQPAAQALLTVLAATADGLDGEQAVSSADRADRPGRPGVAAAAPARTAPRRRAGAARVRRPARRGARRPEPPSSRRLWPGRSTGCARCWPPPRRGHRAHRDPRYTLWQAWERSGLQRRWLAAAERGGSDGAEADRHLDAVTALFDIAEHYVTRTAGASLPGLLDHVGALHLPPVAADTTVRRHRRGAQPARRARPGMGPRRHRRTAGRVVAQHHSARRRAGHPAAARRPRRSGRRRLGAALRCWPRNGGC